MSWLLRVPSSRHRLPKAGFTLIETLAVLAIMAILFAITVNAIAHGIENGHQLRCVGNLVGVANAIKQYRLDYDAYPPPWQPGWPAGIGLPDSRPDLGAVAALAPYSTYVRGPTEQGRLRNYVGGIPMCPNDKLRSRLRLSGRNADDEYGLVGSPSGPWPWDTIYAGVNYDPRNPEEQHPSTPGLPEQHCPQVPVTTADRYSSYSPFYNYYGLDVNGNPIDVFDANPLDMAGYLTLKGSLYAPLYYPNGANRTPLNLGGWLYTSPPWVRDPSDPSWDPSDILWGGNHLVQWSATALLGDDYPALMNPSAPDRTIVFICPYHRQASNTVTLVLRLNGRVEYIKDTFWRQRDVDGFPFVYQPYRLGQRSAQGGG